MPAISPSPLRRAFRRVESRLLRSARVQGRLPLAFAAAAVLALPAAAEAPFDHGGWSRVVQKFVDQRGHVDYDALLADRADFDRYLAEVSRVSPRSAPGAFPSRAHALAYYLNAYNALVFRGVLDRGPERVSVWRGGLVSGYDFFVKRKWLVGGERMSLKALEDDIVRSEFADPRVHAALNCASRGCPRLPRVAFTGEELERQLDEAMLFFVGEERNCRIDPASRTVYLSKIFDWFAKDFLDFERRSGASRPSVTRYLNRYRAAGAAIPDGFTVRFVEYDKGINAQPGGG